MNPESPQPLPKVKICICVALLILVAVLSWSALAEGGWQLIHDRLSSQPTKN